MKLYTKEIKSCFQCDYLEIYVRNKKTPEEKLIGVCTKSNKLIIYDINQHSIDEEKSTYFPKWCPLEEINKELNIEGEDNE